MKTAYIADNQFITAKGIAILLQKNGFENQSITSNKAELIQRLKSQNNAIVVLDYTLFDFNSGEEIIILSHRFPNAYWVLFSTTLSRQIIRQLYFAIPHIAFISKEATENDYNLALQNIIKQKKYTSPNYTEILLQQIEKEQQNLTQTETEVLIAIATGQTTKEIAEKRNLSTHTIVTHRKNIFRKIEVNNLHEATKYAIRAGLINLTEYYI